jgi:SAM-dependent methyltransferase
MLSVNANLEMTAVKPSRFDFDVVANEYDQWYETAEGAMYDRLEKKLIADFLPAEAKGKKVVEVGCGTGHWSRFFSEYGFEVTGLDISERMINAALQKDISNVSFHIADGHFLPFADDSFDLTAAITTLEFVHDVEVVLREMIRCTQKPGGQLLIGLLNGLAGMNKQRKKDLESPYAFARIFSPFELKELLLPYGRVEMTIAGFVPAQSWLIPWSCWIDRIARMFGSQKGAFIAAALKL